MKRFLAFLLTSMLLFSMAVLPVHADTAEASNFSLTAIDTGGAPDDEVTVQYKLVCSNVKSLAIQPATMDGFTLTGDKWLISGAVANEGVEYNAATKEYTYKEAVVTFNTATDFDGVIYTATYKIDKATSSGSYPSAFDYVTVTVVSDESGKEEQLYLYDALGETVKEEGADSFTATAGKIDVHNHGDCLVFVPAKAATCTEEGWVAHWECSKGGQAFVGTNPNSRPTTLRVLPSGQAHIFAKHTFDYEDPEYYLYADEHPATCTEDGLQKDYMICTVCKNKFDPYSEDPENPRQISDEEFETQYVEPATGHTWGEWEETKAASCTEAGSRKHVCTVCKEVETEEIPVTSHKLTKVEKVPETCEADGNEEYWECETCHKLFSDAEGKTETTKEAVTIAAKGHDYAVTYTWSADYTTCTAEGICKNDATHVITETVTATVDKLDPTCTEDGGLTSIAVFKNENFEKQTKNVNDDESLKALGHNLTHVEAKDAKCEEAGNVEYWHCSRCELNFSDEKGTTEIKDTVIPALGHDYAVTYTWSADNTSCTAKAVCKNDDTHVIEETATATDEKQDPTCTEAGSLTKVAVFKNTLFEEQRTEPTPIEALGHDLTHVEAKDTSCKEAGNVEYWHCSRCELNFSDEKGTTEIKDTVIPALPHTWGDWEVTKKATTTEKGLRVRTCTECGEEDEQVIPKLDHEPEPEKIEVKAEEPVVAEDGTVTVDVTLTNTPAEDEDEAVAAIELTLKFDSTLLALDETSLPEGVKLKKAAEGTTEDPDTVTLIVPKELYGELSQLVFKPQPDAETDDETEYTVEIVSVTALDKDGEKVDSAEVEIIEPTDEPSAPTHWPTPSLPSSFEQAMSYYRNQQKIKKAAEEAAAKKAAEEAAKKAAEAAKAAEEAAKTPEAPAIADTWTNPFVDVAETDAYYDAVRYVNESGLFKGVSDTEFAPHVTMNRAMFVTVLGRLAGVDPAAYATTSFTDVEPIGDWNYAPYVEWAAQNGIVLGYGDGTFGPRDEITVEQAAVIIARYAKYIGMDTASGIDLTAFFIDGEAVSEWAADALAWAADNGIYIGVGGALNPQSFAERALVATMLYNFANVCEK
jgi:hypothetical protein